MHVSRRCLAVVVVVALASTGVPARGSTRQETLEHDVENGCGSSAIDVPDNSALIRLIWGDPTAVPELVQWLIDPDSVNYFTGACDIHDRCYGTPGFSKWDCDLGFLSDLTAACADAYAKPREWELFDTLTLGVTYAVDTIWKAVQYTPCVTLAATSMSAAVGVAAWAPYNDAQRQGLVAASCGPDRPQAMLTGRTITSPVLQAAWGSGCNITDVSFAGGRWSAVARADIAVQKSRVTSSVQELVDIANTEAPAGLVLTSLEYGDGVWYSFFTAGTGATRSNLVWAGRFEDAVQLVWDSGLSVTSVEYGDGLWVAYGHDGAGIPVQQVIYGSTRAEVEANQAALLPQGWHLTGLELVGDRWYAVYSRGLPWVSSGLTRSFSNYHDLRVFLDIWALQGFYAHAIEAAPGDWFALLFQPGPTAPAQIAVPNVVGMTEQAAIDTLLALGLITLVEPPDPVGNDGRHLDGVVARQDPPGGSMVDPGEVIEVSVYQWVLTVPDWVGASIEEARGEAAQLGLAVMEGTVELVPRGSPFIDRITATYPEAGTEVDPGTTVIASIGVPSEVDVPDVIGLFEAAARQRVEDGYLVFEIAGYVDAGPDWVGRVVDQIPAPYVGVVPYGSIIRVWIGAAVTDTTCSICPTS